MPVLWNEVEMGMRHFTVWHLVLWFVAGYLNGYFDRDSHRFRGLMYAGGMLLAVVILTLLECK